MDDENMRDFCRYVPLLYNKYAEPTIHPTHNVNVTSRIVAVSKMSDPTVYNVLGGGGTVVNVHTVCEISSGTTFFFW